MRNSLTAIAFGLILLIPASAQSGCGDTLDFGGGGGVFGVGWDIQLHLGSGVPQTSVDSAIQMWNSACSGMMGSYIPFLGIGGSGGTSIEVYYHQGNSSAGCGRFTPEVDGDRHLSGGSIELWANDALGRACDVAETMAHELGHVFGLDNTGSTSCGSIMDTGTVGAALSVSSQDCSWAELQWSTEWELDQERVTCDTECGSTVTGSSCEVQCHAVVTPGDCGTGPAPWSPILLDLDGNGYRLSGLTSGVLFDHNGDGHLELTGWTAEAGGDAFLHLDLNGNGRVDDGRELFGNFTVLPGGGAAPNGFEALAAYDLVSEGGNANGRIDPEDRIWNMLKLWTDPDQNGQSEPGEIKSVTEAGLRSIDLAYGVIGRRDQFGNRLTFRGSAIIETTRTEKRILIYDVFFVGSF